MAIAYMKLKIISRSNGSNIIAAAAYRAGERLKSTEDNRTKNYTGKQNEIEAKAILLPEHAPKEFQDRQTLWQSVEQIEKSGKAQLAREIVLALPNELTKEERIAIVNDYCITHFVSKGMCVDYAIHNKNDGNPHAHILQTTRSIDEHGQWQAKQQTIYKLDDTGNRIPIIDKKTGKQKIGKNGRKEWERQTIKTNDWDNQENCEKWRAGAEKEINNRLTLNNLPTISMKSYERQGLDFQGQLHEGRTVTAIERNAAKNGLPIQTEIRKTNIAIKANNLEITKEYNQKAEQFRNAEKELLLEKAQNQKAITEEKQKREILRHEAENRLHNSPVERREKGDVRDTTPAFKEQEEQYRQKVLKLDKEVKQLTEKEIKLQQQLDRDKARLQKMVTEAKIAGKEKWFFQNEKAVQIAYLKEHGYLELKKRIAEEEKQLSEQQQQKQNVSDEQQRQQRQQYIFGATGAMQKGGLTGFENWCREQQVSLAMREDITNPALKQLDPESRNRVNAEIKERERQFNEMVKAINAKTEKQKVAPELTAQEQLKKKLQEIEQKQQQPKPKAKLAIRHRERDDERNTSRSGRSR